ncbi:MAG: hypothetical protein AB7F89_18150 [Pirellulaceae bacterium]
MARSTEGHRSGARYRRAACWTLIWLGSVTGTAFAQAPTTRCVVVELYVRASEPGTEATVAAVSEFCRGRRGLMHSVRDIEANATNQQRLEQIARHFGITTPVTPLMYVCNRAVTGKPDRLIAELRRALQLEVFVRSGCSRCASAKTYLPSLLARYPALQLVLRDLVYESGASSDLRQLVLEHSTAAASVPVFHLCRRLLVGFDGPATTGVRLEETLSRWTIACPIEQRTSSPPGEARRSLSSAWLLALTSHGAETGVSGDGSDGPHLEALATDPPAQELPLPGDLDLPLPELPGTERGPGRTGEADRAGPCNSSPAGGIELPVFGKVDVDRIGLPAFTIAVGLVDGFNPCAMWVLVFLLSVLVNLHDRGKMFLVAGTFVVISGAAYFAFMAAWLNVFLLIGYLRPIQILLGGLAIVVGAVHIKDFFAFHQGVTFSIPESAKPGIYARVRAIVTAEHVWGALAGACTLAVLVNVVELLCTAGLPALYTEVLTQQDLAAWEYYSYLGLYNLAYMFDDLCLVTTMIITLSRARLQEVHGRWLKLVSGLVILALGAVMILAPDWLL